MFTIIGGDGREYGPVNADQIRRWMAAGRANLDTQAKAAGSEEWHRLGDFAEFSPDVQSPPVIAAVTDEVLASRWTRLGAWFLDNVIAFVCFLPGILAVGSSVLVAALNGQGNLDSVASGRTQLGSFLLMVGGLALLIVQAWLLTTRGQTIGKRVLGIRIVNVADNSNPGFVRAVLLRLFVPGVITGILSVVPGLGLVFFLVDSLYIFRADRRCIHDHIAGTKVIRA